MAASIAQGGYGYPFFSKPVYQYMAGKNPNDIQIQDSDIPVAGIAELIQQVHNYNAALKIK